MRRIEVQRREWQRLGYLSQRKYPAQVVVTWSGEVYSETSFDILDAKIFTALHPDGSPIEVYIITTDNGAAKIRSRILLKYPHLVENIDKLLIPLSPTDNPDEIDLEAIPALLYSKLGMKICNHDGGQVVLRRFCAAGTLCQMNLTMCRGLSLREAVQSTSRIKDEAVREAALHSFDSNVQLFFQPGDTGDCRLPPQLKTIAVIGEDDSNDVSVVTFDCRAGKEIPFM
jgi:hypothetical protein